MINIKQAFMTSEGIVYDFWYDEDRKVEQAKCNFYTGNIYLMHPQRLEELTPGYLRDAIAEQAQKDFKGWEKQWKK